MSGWSDRRPAGCGRWREAGAVESRTDPADRRRTLITPSPSALNVLAQHLDPSALARIGG
ncbi:hypothetical protein KV205_05285 [Streptomyces sp. SKN60]|uniref:hypothetical protein n=1 Tax=Streptomyces sp. SKN60 TaxID=2855506 RepID=UPI0022459900|nr:hypothetical protein [Streptomyces sp. SKN60]MCX2179945.1 hypothetical protein [Streptomyces sp. SKN60]